MIIHKCDFCGSLSDPVSDGYKSDYATMRVIINSRSAMLNVCPECIVRLKLNTLNTVTSDDVRTVLVDALTDLIHEEAPEANS